MTDTTIALIISNAVLLLSGIGKAWWDIQRRKEDRLDREQDRLDREQLAQLTQAKLEAVKAEGGKREKRIVDEVIKTRAVSIKAFKEANGVNAKIEKLGLQLVDKDADPDAG